MYCPRKTKQKEKPARQSKSSCLLNQRNLIMLCMYCCCVFSCKYMAGNLVFITVQCLAFEYYSPKMQF